MSATIKTAILVLVCILATAFVVRTFFPTPEDGKWQSQYEEKAQELEETKTALDAEKSKHESAIEALRSELSGHMDSSATVIAHKEERIADLNLDLAKLEDELESLTDYESKYENVLAQNVSLRRIIVEKDAQLEEKDSLILGITENYEKQLALKDEIIANREKLIAEHESLQGVAQDSIAGLTRENRKLRRQGKILKWASVGLGGYLAFDVAKSALTN